MLYSLGLVLGHLIRLMKSLFLFEDGCHTLSHYRWQFHIITKIDVKYNEVNNILGHHFQRILSVDINTTVIINFPQFIFARRFHFKLILLQHLQNGQDVKLYLKSQKR